MTRSPRCAGWLALAPLALACAAAAPPPFDPVTMDPPGDPDFPPGMVSGAIESGGEPMHAVVYVAEGAGPHPTALLLHGFPGNERNLDLAQALRRAGWNVLFFHYRGAWGSGGSFSFAHLLEDVAVALDWVRAPANAGPLRVDPERLVLIGHSLGGFAALRVGAERPEVDCVVALAAANLAVTGRAAREGGERGRALAGRLERLTGPLAGTSGEALAAEIAAAGEDFDLLRRAGALADRPLLLVAGTLDRATPMTEHHGPLAAALHGAGAAQLTQVIFDADHAFSQRRVSLARHVTSWLRDSCL